MDGFIMENPIKMDDLGGFPPIFGNTQIHQPALTLCSHLSLVNKKRDLRKKRLTLGCRAQRGLARCGTRRVFDNDRVECTTRWWFQIYFYFHPYLGKWSNLTNIFICSGTILEIVSRSITEGGRVSTSHWAALLGGGKIWLIFFRWVETTNQTSSLIIIYNKYAKVFVCFITSELCVYCLRHILFTWFSALLGWDHPMIKVTSICGSQLKYIA